MTFIDASAIQLGHHVAARPYSPPGAFGLALCAIVLASGVTGPFEREPAPDQPVSQVQAANGTRCNCTTIDIMAYGLAASYSFLSV